MFNWWPTRVSDQQTQDLLRETNSLLYDIRAQLLRLTRPKRPFHVIVTPVQEIHMGSEDTLSFAVAIAPLTEPTDVVTRHLTVLVDGAESVHLTTTPAANKFDDISVPEGSAVKLLFVDEDDAANFSAALEYEFTAIDQIPPEQPAGVAVTPVSEKPNGEYSG